MTSERWKTVNELFRAAVERSPAAREAFLASACGEDSALRAEVERLIGLDATATGDAFLEPAPMNVQGLLATPDGGGADRPVEASSSAAESWPSIEGYQIVRELSRGGQGVVYQALQESTKRKVAIKVLLEGAYASKAARLRFEREIELAAHLKHANIISVFHSGRTPDGREYCVMDFVSGQRLNLYVRSKKPTLDETLELFCTVCDAVQYAHQRGVIHRDLKPPNILVDADGSPKVLDFGLARMIGGPKETLLSFTGQLVGTLPYMSPEQARGDADEIDVRADVYSLGVLLYEMLTGGFPYPVTGKMSEVLEHIAGTPPMPPRRTWSADSGVVGRSGKRFRTGQCPIDDEVHTIVLRSLAKERERRYQTAGEFARDIRHYLAGEAIEAKRDSGWYVLKKTLRRYRSAAAVAATFVVMLTASAIALEAERRYAKSEARRANAAAVIADRARVRAEQHEQEAIAARAAEQKRADELEQVTDFQASILSEIDVEALGRGIVARMRRDIRDALEAGATPPERIEAALASFDDAVSHLNATNVALALIDEHLLSRSAAAIEREFATQPLVRAALQQTLADTYEAIGLYEPALVLQEAALRMRRQKLGEDHRGTLTSLSNMGYLLESMGELAEAESYAREALERRRRVLGDDDRDTLASINNVGAILYAMGKFRAAEGFYREALERSRRVLTDDDPITLTALANVGGALSALGAHEQALSYSREALDGCRRVLGDDHPNTLSAIDNLGGLLSSMDRDAEAEPYYREALERRRRVLGDDHPQTLISINNLGFALESLGRYDEAEPLHREALEGRRRVLGEYHPHTLHSLNNLATVLEAMGRLTEAESYYRQALDRSRRVLGDDHPDTLISINNMGFVLRAMGRDVDAEAYYREAVDGYRRALGEDHPDTLISITNLAFLLRTVGKEPEAEGYFRAALAGSRRVMGDEHPRTTKVLRQLVEVLFSLGKPAEVVQIAREVRDAHRADRAGRPDQYAWTLGVLGRALQETGRFAEAESVLREQVDFQRRVQPARHPDIGSALAEFARNLIDQQKFAQATSLLRESLEIRKNAWPDGHWLIFNTISALGESLAGQGADPSLTLAARIENLREAEALLLEGYDGMQDHPEATDERKREALERIVKLYEAWDEAEPNAGYRAKAGEWRTKLEKPP